MVSKQDNADIINTLAKLLLGTEYDADSGKLFVVNSRVACAVNEVLQQYDNGSYFFRNGEEAVFRIQLSDRLNAVLATLETFDTDKAW